MSDPVDEKRLSCFERALERLYEATSTSTPAELQKALGISRQAFYKAKSKGAVPKSWAKKIKETHGINPDWTIKGTGHKDMTSFHQTLSIKVYAMRDIAMMSIHDVARYGFGSLESKYANQILGFIEKLRDRLDERAFKECPDLPKNERLKIYYQGQDRQSSVTMVDGVLTFQPDSIIPHQDGTSTTIEVRSGHIAWMPMSTGKVNIIRALAELGKNMDEVDDLAYLDAAKAKIEARIAQLRQEKGIYGGYARETGGKAPLVHEPPIPYPDSTACGHDPDQPSAQRRSKPAQDKAE